MSAPWKERSRKTQTRVIGVAACNARSTLTPGWSGSGGAVVSAPLMTERLDIFSQTVGLSAVGLSDPASVLASSLASFFPSILAHLHSLSTLEDWILYHVSIASRTSSASDHRALRATAVLRYREQACDVPAISDASRCGISQQIEIQNQNVIKMGAARPRVPRRRRSHLDAFIHKGVVVFTPRDIHSRERADEIIYTYSCTGWVSRERILQYGL